ncbi:MAG: beta-lactamase family protein, partial [Delftia sp.]|nr:beta-lactamase family protein [Delftia sp.]
LFQLTDPVSKFIAEFKHTKVYMHEGKLADLERPITIRDVLTHTAGLSYDFFDDSPVHKLYGQAGLRDDDITLQEMVRRLASLPLLHQPGQAWHYSMATDVVGRLVEILADTSLAEFFETNIFRPLGMVDTAFDVPAAKIGRLATLYGEAGVREPRSDDDGALNVLETPAGSRHNKPVRRYSGSSGLVSTAADYARFAQLVLNQGALDGARLLGRKTIELMTANHLPPALLPMILEEPMPGLGFGLGFKVLQDVAQAGLPGSLGSHGWGGAASTNFWV